MITKATVFALCALHAMRNALKGNNGKKQVSNASTLITSLARAATQHQYNNCLERMTKVASPTFMNYVVSHSNEFTYMGLNQTQGLLTNYGLDTNNPVEQSNNRFAEIRSRAVVDMFTEFIKNQGSLFTAKLRKAIEYKRQLNYTVVPAILSKTKLLAVSMQKEQWTNQIISWNENANSNNDGTTIIRVTYIVCTSTQTAITSSSSSASSSGMKSYQVTLSNQSNSQWFENVVCPCNWTLTTGRPCKHAAFCLLFPSAIDSNKFFQTSAHFKFDLSKWYSDVYHLDTMVKQYNVSITAPCFDSLVHYQLWPPRIMKLSGRKSIKRKTRKPTSNIICSGCNNYGHSVTTCRAKDSGAIIDNHKLSKIILQFEPITADLIQELKPKFDVGIIHMKDNIVTVEEEEEEEPFDEKSVISYDLNDEGDNDDEEFNNNANEKQFQATTSTSHHDDFYEHIIMDNPVVQLHTSSSFSSSSYFDVINEEPACKASAACEEYNGSSGNERCPLYCICQKPYDVCLDVIVRHAA